MADVTTVFAAKDESFAQTVTRLQETLSGFERGVQTFNAEFAQVGRAFTSVATKGAALVLGFVGVNSAFDAVKQSFNKAAEFQDLQRRFETLLGSTIAAEQRMEELSKFMDRTPFELPGIVQANITLQNLTQGAMATERGMELVGDAASALGVPLTEMAQVIGRVYTSLDAGQPVGQLNRRLVELGALTPEASRELAELSQTVDGGRQAWNLIEQELSKFTGSMQRQSTTWNATMSGFGDAINEAMRAFASPLIDELTPKLQAVTDFVREKVAPAIGEAMTKFVQDIYPAMQAAFQRAYDFFVGLWQDPQQIFGLFGSYLDAQLRLAGDTLATAFMTAVSTLGNLLTELIDRGAFSKFGDILANAFVFGVTKFNLELMNAMEGAIRFWGGLWDLVTGRGSKDFANKLYDVVQFFATDFGRAMIDPIGFIGNKVASALMGATAEASEDYQYAFDAASGAWVDKHKAGLEGAHQGAGQRLRDAADDFGNILVESTKAAASNAKVVEVNLFGGKEAVERTNELASEITQRGAEFRLSMEGSVPPTEEMKENARQMADYAGNAEDSMRTSASLSQDISLNLGAAASSSQQIPPAFDLAADKSGDIRFDLESTAEPIENVEGWLGEGAGHTEQMSIHGRSVAESGEQFANSIANAKIDAQITANVFTGLSDRMQSAVRENNQMLDKMREVHHFGKQTQQEVYEGLKAGGMNIVEASQTATKISSLNEEKTQAMKRAEREAYSATYKYTRDMKRAADMESIGQWRSAYELQNRTTAQLTERMERINDTLKVSVQEIDQKLAEAAEGVSNTLQSGGSTGGEAVRQGGQAAGAALENAAAAINQALSGQTNQGLALESTLQACRDFLENIDRNLPQNSLSP